MLVLEEHEPVSILVALFAVFKLGVAFSAYCVYVLFSDSGYLEVLEPDGESGMLRA